MPLTRGLGEGGLLVGCLKQTFIIASVYFQTIGEMNQAEVEPGEADPETMI